MKKLIPFVSLGILAVLTSLVAGCFHDDVPGNGGVRFAFQNSNSSSSGRIASGNTPAFIQYVIETPDGETKTDVVPVYPFGSEYISEQQALPTGNYTLEEYFILDKNNKVIYAAVIEGAPLEQLVNITLPIGFRIAADETTSVSPDVLPVEEYHSPEVFGYAKWTYNVTAQLVKFVLPVHKSVLRYFNAATITIKQGGYTKTAPMTKTVNEDYIAQALIRPNVPVDISVSVDIRNIHFDYLVFNRHEANDVFQNTSVSGFDYHAKVDAIASDFYALNEFKYKIGNGWKFNFAEIISNGANGSWLKVRYDENFFLNGTLTVTSNAEIDTQRARADKILWNSTKYVDDNWPLVDFFYETSCSDVCTSTANFAVSVYGSENWEMYKKAYHEDRWMMIDSEVRGHIKYRQKDMLIATYFKLMKDVDEEIPTLSEPGVNLLNNGRRISIAR